MAPNPETLLSEQSVTEVSFGHRLAKVGPW
jgi:hypothetical protein